MALFALHNQTTFHVGDTVNVHYRILEKQKVSGKTKGETHEEQKERIQIFSGIVLAISGKDTGKSFVVRHIGAGNIGVERIFPLFSPWIRQVTVERKGHVRRAKLYYLRTHKGREATQVKEKKEVQVIKPKVTHENIAKGKLGRTTRRTTPAK